MNNIIDNAAQAIIERGNAPSPGTITVASRVAADQLILSIDDNGHGIAADTLPRIFDSLFSTRSFGLGLGLPTARKIIEQHGGTVGVDSAWGRVTEVTITLPLAGARNELDTARDAA